MVPRIARPRAPPSSELVSEMPEAAPARSGGALPTARSAANVNSGARPSERMTTPATTSPGPPVAPACISSAMPTTATRIPPSITTGWPDPGGQRRRQLRADDERGGAGQAPQPCLERRVAEHELEVLGDEDRDSEHDRERERVGAERKAERAAAEQREVDHRVGQSALAVDEHAADGKTGHDGGQAHDVDAVLGDGLDAVDHGQHGGQRERRAGQVEPARLRGPCTRGGAAGRSPAAAPSPGPRAGRPSPSGSSPAARRRRAGRSPRRPRSS